MSFTSFMVRTLFKKGDDKRDAGLTTPECVERFDDIQYGIDPKWNVLDVYRNRDIDGKQPLIVSIHGGGWVYGDKERYQFYCMDLVKRGFSVVNFTYGLAPKFKYPSQLKDCNDVFTWIMNNAEKYGFDTDHIFAVGDSAGGHLLALYSCLLNNDEMKKEYSFQVPEGLKLKAVALNCGVYEMKKEDKGLTANLMKDFLPNKGTVEEYRMISPINYVNEKFPPCIVMTASDDFLKDQAMPMVNRLKEKGVDVRYMFYGDDDHKLGHVFHLNMRSDDAKKCNDDQCDYFKEFLR